MIVNTFVNSALILLAYVSLWYILSIILKRADIVDIAWGLGYVVLVFYYLLSTDITSRGVLVATLIIIWGLRLAIFVFSRNRKKKEDFRYMNWRNTWKNFYLRSYIQIFLLQGALLLIIISPVSIMFSQTQGYINTLDVLGLLVWLAGFLFETVGDQQLIEFKKKPENKGKIITTGLWSYTRHPNYFGEVLLWWGIFIITLSSPYWYLGFLGPVTITVLILFVSGIPMLEEKYDNNPEYQEYKKRTSMFIPLPPRRVVSGEK